MLYRHFWFLIVIIIFAGLQFWACQKHNDSHHALVHLETTMRNDLCRKEIE